MNSKSSADWLERFFMGKGFYIVLVLCAAVIGASAWMLAVGDKPLTEKAVEVVNTAPAPSHEKQEVIAPQREDLPVFRETTGDSAPVISAPEKTEEAKEVFGEDPAPVDPTYAWPLQGEVARFHDPDTLHYDETLGDWRTHQGIDILAPLGETVTAAHAGRVERVQQHDLLGTVVVVSHEDGFTTVYANLEENPAVSEGDWVEAGSVIGTVGSSALSEVSEESHLHFAVRLNGVDRDPLEYLPA